MSVELLVIVPTRGRPDAMARVWRAWQDTGALDDGAALMFAVDGDDPMFGEYLAGLPSGAGLVSSPTWRPMVVKLNEVARERADRFFALAFMGDDHLPRTTGWARAYLDALRELGTGIVYGDDRIQGANLPTQWAMTSDIVRTLGRMVPADVQHLYCDNAIAVLGQAAGCLRYLPDVVVEHMHPLAGKAEMDDGYRRVNSTHRYREDRAAFLRWVAEGFDVDAARVKALREVAVHG